MYKIKLTNASIEKVFSLRNLTISKLVYREGHEENHQYQNRRRIGIIITNFLSKRKVIMEYTNRSGINKCKKFGYCGGLIISW